MQNSLNSSKISQHSNAITSSATTHDDILEDTSHLYHFTAEKAGMDGVDKHHVQKIVHAMSKNSKHYYNARKLEARNQERIEKMIQNLHEAPPAALAAASTQAKAYLSELEVYRRLDRVWVVIDMDMFFAAVEMRDDPKLKTVPMAVGGIGMISTSNYLARKFGVRAAMPGFIAKKLCPDLVFVRPNFQKYSAVAGITRGIFAKYDPNFSSMSLDEAFLDLTDYIVEQGLELDEHCGGVDTHRHAIESIVNKMRSEIQCATGGLTCSAGIASNRMLAKICSDMNKPDGQFYLSFTREAAISFMSKLSIRKVPGIGKVAEHTLNALDINTGQDVIEQAANIYYILKPNLRDHILRAALGIGSAERRGTPSPRKGISVERTFRAVSDPQQLKEICRTIACRLSERMKQHRTAIDFDSQSDSDDEASNLNIGDTDDISKAADTKLSATVKGSGGSYRHSPNKIVSEGDTIDSDSDKANKEKGGFKGRSLTIKLKLHDFSVRTRTKTLQTVTNDADLIFENAFEMLEAEFPVRIRLLGIRMSQLVFPADLNTGIGRFLHQSASSSTVDTISETLSVLEKVEHKSRSENGHNSLDRFFQSAQSKSANFDRLKYQPPKFSHPKRRKLDDFFNSGESSIPKVMVSRCDGSGEPDLSNNDKPGPQTGCVRHDVIDLVSSGNSSDST